MSETKITTTLVTLNVAMIIEDEILTTTIIIVKTLITRESKLDKPIMLAITHDR